MFDLLPDDAVGSNHDLPDAALCVISKVKRILKAGRINPSDNADPCNVALNRLGVINRRTLKQKVLFRTEIVLGCVGTHFPELRTVVSHAIDCRNVFVHGNSAGGRSSGDYSAQLVFLTDTLEFVFGISDWSTRGGMSRAGWQDPKDTTIHSIDTPPTTRTT